MVKQPAKIRQALVYHVLVVSLFVLDNARVAFVTVHAKIARGAYARWLIQNRIEDLDMLKDFNEIGYTYNKQLSSPEEPVFVAQEFKGLGLSIRLTK